MSLTPLSPQAHAHRIAQTLGYTRTTYTWIVPGQPIPAPRLTQASAHHPVIPRGYYQYKGLVVKGLLDDYASESLFLSNMAWFKKPFAFDRFTSHNQLVLEYWLWFRQAKTGTCMHGDPDNVAKAILDALFTEDRHVLPRCQGLVCGAKEPRTVITVTFL